jgi:hypothetical protein
MTAVREPATADRSVDLQLARAHLRLGMYAFARAELESLLVRSEMDRDGLTDLAEARWRTGDLAAAGHAAQAHLDAGGDDTTSLVVAAEAAVADGRVADGRVLADRALARDIDLDALFAGLPRSRVWRPGTSHETPTEVLSSGALLGQEVAGSRAGELPAADAREEAPEDEDATRMAAPPERPLPRPAPARPEEPTVPGTASGRSPHQLIAFAATALRGDRGRAAVELAVVLRSEPSLAPAVIELLARTPDPPASRSSAALEIVRGDAYRLIGRPREAEIAYARAVSMLQTLDGLEPLDPGGLGEPTT